MTDAIMLWFLQVILHMGRMQILQQYTTTMFLHLAVDGNIDPINLEQPLFPFGPNYKHSMVDGGLRRAAYHLQHYYL